MTKLDTTVHLFDGHRLNLLDLGEPVWTGTLFEYWEANQDAFVWGDMREIIDSLDNYDRAHVGGGAAPEQTLTTILPLARGTRVVDRDGYEGTIVNATYFNRSVWYDVRLPGGVAVRWPTDLTVRC